MPWVNEMDTPICDFVRRYAESQTLRLHMPGHKGQGPLGVEHLDITEVSGADSLYEADGIIAQSERNASVLFGCPTFYSTEGSSQCIRAMVHLAQLHARAQGKRPLIAAGRNAHKAFLSAVGLLDVKTTWLYPRQPESYLSCCLTAQEIAEQLSPDTTAVYLTSPDYLGNVADIATIAKMCRQKGVLLLVDNAHGAYLRFLYHSKHPMDLGADLCCDSAHKTLPVLTGGAYLHIRDRGLAKQAKNALALFGSTSPSYLILQSLDAANDVLCQNYRGTLAGFLHKLENTRLWLTTQGYTFVGNEPMKLTIAAKPYGYTGTELAACLRNAGIECEFADPDYLVLMPTPHTTAAQLQQLERTLMAIPRRSPIADVPPAFRPAKQMLSLRNALLRPQETIPVSESKGRILAAASVGCPPAVPILVCGERIDENAIRCFQYSGIETVTVVK